MSIAAPNASEIWTRKSEIWPDFAKSEICAQSGIWVFCRFFNGLTGLRQISDGLIRNLTRNLDFLNEIMRFCQIPDFGKGTPKGVGGLPPSGGEVHHPPLGDFVHRDPVHPFIEQPEKRSPQMAATPTFPSSTILALDLGTTTGWALRGQDGLITSGTVSLRPGRYDGGGMRYLRFTNWLTEIDRLSGPVEAIWFEEVRRHAGTDAAHVYGGLMATLTAWAELRGVPYEGVPVGTIKRHATGKGNAPKQAMIDAARARGFSPADDNEADAIAILLWAIETKGGLA
ncbi:hypothetical protein [Mesobacterium hydrothermale]|uniref:crossover junction endodeoxyribonuclease RuvC n=1 Tax=Mesobacterium hydrothermale TaxID=3111907 RepID=UPI003F490EA7